jgi:hypothetical protein
MRVTTRTRRCGMGVMDKDKLDSLLPHRGHDAVAAMGLNGSVRA